MTRQEHNRRWNVNRQPEETVHCHTVGYGEYDQYDPQCAACWVGNGYHTWAEHDRLLLTKRGGQ